MWMQMYLMPVLDNSDALFNKLIDRGVLIPEDLYEDKTDANSKYSLSQELVIYGLRHFKPSFFECNWKNIQFENKWNIKINGNKINLNKNIILCFAVEEEKAYADLLKNYFIIPSLVTIIDIQRDLSTQYRKWIAQLKEEVLTSIRVSIAEDKIIDSALFDDFPFNFPSENFEDPIDVIDFMNNVVECRINGANIKESIITSFSKVIANQISVLEVPDINVLLSLIITNDISQIEQITRVNKIKKILEKLQDNGFVHLYGDEIVLTQPFEKLKDGNFLEKTISFLKIEDEKFKEIDPVYTKVLQKIRPQIEIEPILTKPFTKKEAIVDFKPDSKNLEMLVETALLSNPINGLNPENVKSLDPNELIKISNNILKDELNNLIRSNALLLRAFAYFRRGELENSSRDLSNVLDLNPTMSNTVAIFYNEIGIAYSNSWHLQKAIEYYEKSLSRSEKLGEVQGIAKTYNNLGKVYYLQGEWNKAIEEYKRSLSRSEKLRDEHGIAQTYNNLGEFYHDKREWNKAIEYYNKSLSRSEKLGDVYGIADTYNNLGKVYHDKGEWNKAIQYYEKDLEISRILGDVQGIAQTYGNLGTVYSKLGEWNKAIEYYEMALLIFKKLGDKINIEKVVKNIELCQNKKV